MLNKNFLSICLVMLVLVFSTGCVVNKVEKNADKKADQPVAEINSDKAVAPAVKKEVKNNEKTTPTTPVVAPKSESTKCTSMACLIDLAKSCAKGEVLVAYSFPFPLDTEMGLTLHSNTYYQIKGKNSAGNCEFIQQNKGGSATLSEAGRQGALARGETEAEITAELKAMTDSFNDPALLKRVMTCTGASADVVTYLTNTMNGVFSSECSMTLNGEETCKMAPNLNCVSK